MSTVAAKSGTEDAAEECGSTSSSSTPTGEHSVVLSPLTSMPEDFRAALDAFRHDWQREINTTTAERAVEQAHVATNVAENAAAVNTDNYLLAMSLFRQAVELEQRGKVYDALPLYRRAIQIVPDIELKFYDQQKLRTNEQTDRVNVLQVESTTEQMEIVDNLLEKFELDIDNDYNGRLILSNRDAGVLSTGLHISDLPTELLLYILRWVISNQLDVRSIENCAATCKGLYVCARDDEIWRLACVKVWGANVGTLERPRAMPTDHEQTTITLLKKYPDWRRMFIDRERVLYHGCYISKTTYLRMGENSFQDQFYRPLQLVEYYRYMRFLPDGSVLIMTTADEPQVGVTKLKNIYQLRADVTRGKYFLNDNKLTVLVNKAQQQQQGIQRRLRRGNTASDESNCTKYRLEVRIASTSKRKFGKLMWLNYSIVTVRNKVENVTEFEMTPTKYPPLWFSPVRSYHLDADSPLN